MINFYKSTIGKKVIVALTGLILFGFVIGHLLGNLQIFAGAQQINDYAEFLHDNPGLVWGTRLILLLAVFLHVVTTIQLVSRNRESRPISYNKQENIQSTLASRIMIGTGLLLVAYIVFHLLHLTWGVVHPSFEHHNSYANMVQGFSVWYVSGFYVVAMVALGYHLHHGIWSAFQTLGLNHPKYNCWRRIVATFAAICIAAGYISIPIAVLLKWIQ